VFGSVLHDGKVNDAKEPETTKLETEMKQAENKNGEAKKHETKTYNMKGEFRGKETPETLDTGFRFEAVDNTPGAKNSKLIIPEGRVLRIAKRPEATKPEEGKDSGAKVPEVKKSETKGGEEERRDGKGTKVSEPVKPPTNGLDRDNHSKETKSVTPPDKTVPPVAIANDRTAMERKTERKDVKGIAGQGEPSKPKRDVETKNNNEASKPVASGRANGVLPGSGAPKGHTVATVANGPPEVKKPNPQGKGRIYETEGPAAELEGEIIWASDSDELTKKRKDSAPKKRPEKVVPPPRIDQNAVKSERAKEKPIDVQNKPGPQRSRREEDPSRLVDDGELIWVSETETPRRHRRSLAPVKRGEEVSGKRDLGLQVADKLAEKKSVAPRGGPSIERKYKTEGETVWSSGGEGGGQVSKQQSAPEAIVVGRKKSPGHAMEGRNVNRHSVVKSTNNAGKQAARSKEAERGQGYDRFSFDDEQKSVPITNGPPTGTRPNPDGRLLHTEVIWQGDNPVGEKREMLFMDED
jgi:hypothetical protein